MNCSLLVSFHFLLTIFSFLSSFFYRSHLSTPPLLSSQPPLSSAPSLLVHRPTSGMVLLSVVITPLSPSVPRPISRIELLSTPSMTSPLTLSYQPRLVTRSPSVTVLSSSPVPLRMRPSSVRVPLSSRVLSFRSSPWLVPAPLSDQVPSSQPVSSGPATQLSSPVILPRRRRLLLNS